MMHWYLARGGGYDVKGARKREGVKGDGGFSIPRGDLPLVCHQPYRYLMKHILMPAPVIIIIKKRHMRHPPMSFPHGRPASASTASQSRVTSAPRGDYSGWPLGPSIGDWCDIDATGGWGSAETSGYLPRDVIP